MPAVLNSFSLPTCLQILLCLSLGLRILGLYAQSLTLSKFFEWCGFTALCLCLVPSSPRVMSFNSYVLSENAYSSFKTKVKLHLSQQKYPSGLQIAPSSVVPLLLIDWQSSPLSPRTEKPCLTCLGSIFPALQKVWQRKGTQNIWLETGWENIRIPFHIH